jgi:hypothetical protein
MLLLTCFADIMLVFPGRRITLKSNALLRFIVALHPSQLDISTYSPLTDPVTVCAHVTMDISLYNTDYIDYKTPLTTLTTNKSFFRSTPLLVTSKSINRIRQSLKSHFT